MREQPLRVQTHAARKQAALLASSLTMAVLSAAIVFAVLYQPTYMPPHFESGAVAGFPNPPEKLKYSKFDAMDTFMFMIAGVMVRQKDGSLLVYLTNPQENYAYLMCEIVDSNDKTLYKSGLLRPGEYVANLHPIVNPDNKVADIRIHIYALEPERFISIGTVTLINTLQPYDSI